MTAERELLSAKYGRAGLYFEEPLGAFIIKEVAGYFLRDASFLTDAAVDSIVKNSFIKTVTEEGEVVQGDVRDIANKSIRMQRITLTDQNFYLIYKKGFRSKKQKLIMLPLKYAKDARTQGFLRKEVLISFEVPQKEEKKAIFFDLSLRVIFHDIWINAINCAISVTLLGATEEKVFGCIGIMKRSRHGLYFTKNRVIVAKQEVSLKWALLSTPIVFFGTLLIWFYFDALIHGYALGYEFVTSLLIGVTLIVGTFGIGQAANNRKHKKLLRSAPNDILAYDKNNFEIPYSNIAQVELRKSLGFRNKIRIVTDSKSYQFGILNKKLLNYHMSLVRWVLPERKLILPAIKEKKLPTSLQ